MSFIERYEDRPHPPGSPERCQLDRTAYTLLDDVRGRTGNTTGTS